MSLRKKSRFAHLFGTPRAATDDEDEDQNARRAEGEDPEDGEDEGGKDEPPPRKSRKSRKAKKAGKAKKAEDDGDDAGDDDAGDDDADAEDEDDEEKASARARERGRCAAIFSDPAAALNPVAAAELAFNTNMPRSAAINLLRVTASAMPQAPVQASAPSALNRLDERMASSRVQPVPTRRESSRQNGGGDDATALANRMMQRHKSLTGK
ncbi:hypothetical protein ACM0P6_02865 [Komagataeibacter sucrofermentans]|nr:hypothetical protein [Komagataeibacter sucrofermentans]GBQ52239.1 hypothetical protein AA15973_2708 [Komagataeibacter sucrofermentans DSM 15973]